MGLKKSIWFLVILLISFPLSNAETTFFDNPDEDFIVESSATGGIIITEQQTGGGGGCNYKWSCTIWRECSPDGKQTRSCINLGSCSDEYKTPKKEQDCTYVPSSKDTEEEKNLGTGKTKDNEEVREKESRIIYWSILLVTCLIIFCLIILCLKRKDLWRLIRTSRCMHFQS